MVLYRTIKKCSQYEDLGRQSLPAKKGENLKFCDLFFKKGDILPKKWTSVAFWRFFFPQKKKKLHHNHPNSIFAHSCECSEYKSTAAIFFRSIGQLTWGLRFRKNPLKLQINSSSIEIRSWAFLFLFLKLPKGDTVFWKGNILPQMTFLKNHQIDDRKQFFWGRCHHILMYCYSI